MSEILSSEIKGKVQDTDRPCCSKQTTSNCILRCSRIWDSLLNAVHIAAAFFAMPAFGIT